MLVILPTLRVSAASRGNSELEENRTEDFGRENELQTHPTELRSVSPHARSRFCGVVRVIRQGWADTAHTTDNACRPYRTISARQLPRRKRFSVGQPARAD